MTHTQYAIEHDNRLIPTEGKDTWPMCTCMYCDQQYDAEAMTPETSVCIEDVCWRVECQQKHVDQLQRTVDTLRKEHRDRQMMILSFRRELIACAEILRDQRHPYADIALATAKQSVA